MIILNVGCGFRHSSQPNVIVLAVEGLGFDRVPCQNDTLTDGFATLCQESIRFTHAYVNSTNSLANMTSILTADFPWEHGVRGQSQWLRPHRETIPELAVERGYQTAFISSGLPMLAKSGLVQGFENFDDRIDLFSRPHFRPAAKVVKAFLKWLDQENPKSFFSVLHFSDPLFPFEVSANSEGELRDLSVSSQLEEVSEELAGLIAQLKERDLWNSSLVALVGLSGGQNPSSLKSDQTQVTLLIKPPRVKRDQATSWSVDDNVSVTDLGVSLYERIVGALPSEMKGKASLSSVYSDPEPDWDQNRLILTENYWSFENFGLDIVYSARRKHWFYIHEDPPRLYNTLTDRQEQAPLPLTDAVYAQNFDAFREFFEMDWPRARLTEVPAWFSQGVEGFRKGRWEQYELKASTQPLKSWLLRNLIEKGRWETLREEFSSPLMEYIAAKKIKPGSERRALVRDLPCGKAFSAASLKTLDHLRESCDQDRLLEYVDWARFKGTSDELFYENKFKRAFQFWWARLELGAMNQAAFGSLGLPLTWPKPPDLSEWLLIEREKNPQARQLMENYTSSAKF